MSMRLFSFVCRWWHGGFGDDDPMCLARCSVLELVGRRVLVVVGVALKF